MEFFHDFVRSLFLHRRKFLRGVLNSALKDRLDKPAVDRLLEVTGLEPTQRADELDVPTMLALTDATRGLLATRPQAPAP